MKEKTPGTCRLNRVGGEAVLEGVMMKAGERCATACRLEDGGITVVTQKFISLRKTNKLCNIPILRGCVNFVEMMKLSFRSLNTAAEALGIDDEEEESRFEKWLRTHLGVKFTDFIMGFAAILGVALAVFLFMFLPSLAAKGLQAWTSGAVTPILSLIEGILKIGIFVGYIALVSLLPDIKRTFQYHGAEHKSIAAFESGGDLTPENARNYTRFHPRCGTSFMFVMILLGIIVGFFIPSSLPALARSGIKLLLLPIVVGVGFEFIMYAGKHDNLLVRFLSAPGLWMQRLTTKEPDEKQLEVAITALKFALIDEFPDFNTRAFTVKNADTGEIVPAEKPAEAESAAEVVPPAEVPQDAAQAIPYAGDAGIATDVEGQDPATEKESPVAGAEAEP